MAWFLVCIQYLFLCLVTLCWIYLYVEDLLSVFTLECGSDQAQRLHKFPATTPVTSQSDQLTQAWTACEGMVCWSCWSCLLHCTGSETLKMIVTTPDSLVTGRMEEIIVELRRKIMNVTTLWSWGIIPSNKDQKAKWFRKKIRGRDIH